MAKVETKHRGFRKDKSEKMPKVKLVSEAIEFEPAPHRKDEYHNRKELRDVRTGRDQKKHKTPKNMYMMGSIHYIPDFYPKHQKVKGYMRDKNGKLKSK